MEKCIIYLFYRIIFLISLILKVDIEKQTTYSDPSSMKFFFSTFNNR